SGLANGDVELNDVWSLSLADSQWTALSPAGTPPMARHGSGGIYDAGHDRLVAFGGATGSTPLNDTWMLALSDGGTWLQIASTGPAARSLYGVATDATGHRMFATFGLGTGAGPNDTWSLALDDVPTWSEVHSGYPK